MTFQGCFARAWFRATFCVYVYAAAAMAGLINPTQIT